MSGTNPAGIPMKDDGFVVTFNVFGLETQEQARAFSHLLSQAFSQIPEAESLMATANINPVEGAWGSTIPLDWDAALAEPLSFKSRPNPSDLWPVIVEMNKKSGAYPGVRFREREEVTVNSPADQADKS